MTEIAKFLRVHPRRVLIFLRDQSMLRETRPGPCRPTAKWTTARGVGLCVAHFRHLQGHPKARLYK